MKYAHVLGGLIDKRRELMQRIDQTSVLMRQLAAEMDALDGAIRIFDPNVKLDRIRPKAAPIRHAAHGGENMEPIFAALRAATEPMSTLALTFHTMAARGLDTEDAKLVSIMRKRVGATLRHFQRKRMVRSRRVVGDPFYRWEMAT
jgi:hypothetical protein